MEKNKKESYVNISSFTLIEIIISVSIIILFTGLGLASYNHQNQEQKLKEEGQKLVSVLELAKKKTYSGDKSNQTCNDFNGYQLLLNNSNQYLLKLCCNNDCSSSFNIQTYSITSRFLSPSPGSYVWFQPLISELKFDSGTSLTITIKNDHLNKCLSINISRFGLINLNDSLTSC